MAFAPLPADLLDRLQGLRDEPVLELGCGDGRFGRELSALGVATWGLDRVPPARGSAARIVGDVRRPPLRPGCWGLVVAPNLVRHLGGAGPLRRVLELWCDLLRPEGSLYVFEDAPGRAGPAERHFGELQALLADMPGRGPLLPWAGFSAILDRMPGVLQAAGEAENRYPLDAARVVEFLESGRPDANTPAGELARAIREDGIACGHYWWARLGRGR